MPKPCARCGDELADAAEAEDAERLVRRARRREYFERSQRPVDERGVRLRDVAREREQQRHRVLGRGDDVRLRRVGDDDPALGRGGDVDVVDADAGAADGAAGSSRCSIRSAVDLRRRADEDAVVVADARSRSKPVGVERGVDVEVLAQQVDRRSRRSSRRRGRGVMPCCSTTKSMQAVSAWTSSGSIAGNIATRSWLRPELAVGLDVDDAVGAQRRGDRGGVDARRRSRSCRRRASAWPGRRRTASRTRVALGPAVEVVRGRASCGATRPVAGRRCSSIHSSWSASSSSVATAGVL